MFAKELISEEIPVLHQNDTGNRALELMGDFKIRHLPLIDHDEYVCLVSDKDVFGMRKTDDPIGKVNIFAPAVREDRNWTEALNIADRFNLSLVPVVTENNVYLGCITLKTLIAKSAEMFNVSAEGSILILEVNPQDYTLSEIAKIVESNNAKILSLFTGIIGNTNKLRIWMKINLEDASPVIRSFERFNYNVLFYFMRRSIIDDLLQKRLDEFLHYLKI
ncbi:MAG: CBS domain-containing protein [Candidatus Azobacteroides sp.]|nr:CBS domain-containing protein [Candidatus Azobacteroides sp.]